jgi:hypothetical protein
VCQSRLSAQRRRERGTLAVRQGQLPTRLHKRGYRACQVAYYPSIQIGIQPLTRGTPIPFSLLCPLLALFFSAWFLLLMYAILKEHQRRPPGSLKSLFGFLSFPQEAVFCLLVWPLDLSFQIFAAGHGELP